MNNKLKILQKKYNINKKVHYMTDERYYTRNEVIKIFHTTRWQIDKIVKNNKEFNIKQLSNKHKEYCFTKKDIDKIRELLSPVKYFYCKGIVKPINRFINFLVNKYDKYAVYPEFIEFTREDLIRAIAITPTPKNINKIFNYFIGLDYIKTINHTPKSKSYRATYKIEITKKFIELVERSKYNE